MKKKKNIFDQVKKYHFELRHLSILLIILIFFLVSVSFVHKTSLQGLLIRTQDWYQQDSAERLANLTATSLELLMETSKNIDKDNEEEIEKVVQAFNIVLNQQKLQQNVDEVCLLISYEKKIYAIVEGIQFFNFFFRRNEFKESEDYQTTIELYENELRDIMQTNEQIYSIPEGKKMFHVFVPFVPEGEYVGALYMKNTPDFTFITKEIISSYDETALIFASLIILGLLAMFYVSSYSVKERDEAQVLLYNEKEKHLLEKVEREKEELFTKRIYHTHHKAEKVMGFIKEDLRILSKENIEKIQYSVVKYANFISRVIYDMKWYDPPIQTIRNPLFHTDINEVIQFIVNYIFLRTSKNLSYQFTMELDENLPSISINEFVVWEILEPLIQNCVEHSKDENIVIVIKTHFNSDLNLSKIIIEDNGKGFESWLLELNENRIMNIFDENVSTKITGENSGYGCYIAYQLALRRCGWKLSAENKTDGGARFIIEL